MNLVSCELAPVDLDLLAADPCEKQPVVVAGHRPSEVGHRAAADVHLQELDQVDLAFRGLEEPNHDRRGELRRALERRLG